MFTNVLVPVDGTSFGEHALPWALAAVGERAAVRLVHVHVPPAPMMVEGVVVADPTLDQSLRAQESAYLEDLCRRVQAAAPGLAVDAWNLDTDDPVADALAKAAEDTGADLVVMATHGRGPFARFWLGSTADDFSRASPVPVLFHHPPDGPADLSAWPRLGRVIIPLDGSDLAERIVDPAARLARTFGAEVTLLLVLDALDDPDAAARIAADEVPDVTNPLTPAQRAEHYLDRVTKRVAELGATAHTKLVREGSPAAVVLEAAGGDRGTAVAMATHGRSGITRLLMGSAADGVIRGAAGPVLVYHPPE